MALISAKTIITSVSLFHITIAYFFLTSPSTVDNQAMVYVLGESMGMPYARGFESQSAPLAFLAAILILVGFSDLVSLSMPDEVCLVFHWGTQAPLRFIISLGFLFYVFFLGPSSPAYSSGRVLSHPSAHNPSYHPSGWGGDGLKNRVFFTFMFVEMLTWFWIWVTLREERTAILERKSKRRNSQANF